MDSSPDPLPDLRLHYTQGVLRSENLAADPIDQFRRWLDDALAASVMEPNAMTVATVDAEGMPSARTLLLKGLQGGRFRFFTNYESRKGCELATNPRAAMVFLWRELERQVCVRGCVAKASMEDSEAYFISRPYESQIGAWASTQSRPCTSREALEEADRVLRERYPEGKVPLPPFWGGFDLTPETVEFWQGRPGRLHDRFLYERSSDSNTWTKRRLFP